ncbi:hypothetical protein CDAR_297341 [Caerostris darwini]|uniref:Uncharacterized protein n=1 Tax=Caerostris darwini TaxID=1538125 RepID=A0AAV4PU82_9ARAC|nr:hypothetical protein CDAR_297341 [Caerostris darwini]
MVQKPPLYYSSFHFPLSWLLQSNQQSAKANEIATQQFSKNKQMPTKRYNLGEHCLHQKVSFRSLNACVLITVSTSQSLRHQINERGIVKPYTPMQLMMLSARL